MTSGPRAMRETVSVPEGKGKDTSAGLSSLDFHHLYFHRSKGKHGNKSKSK